MASSDPEIVQPDKEGYYHPTTEAEIQNLVKYAGKNSLQVRVKGSSHSVDKAIFTDPDDEKPNVSAPKTNINIVLDQYYGIVKLPVKDDFVTVEAGIHLGRDPRDPNSTDKTSLLYQLDEYQLTLEHLGGISHQTVGGFLSTSSSGGSIKYGLLGTVYGLRIIDGKGEPYEVSRAADGTPSAEFQAALVSMGVLGVISTVTFKCTKAFNIKGKNESEFVESSELVDIYCDNPDSRSAAKGLNSFFKETDFARILWWPQTSDFVIPAAIKDIIPAEIEATKKEKIQTWHAKKIYTQVEPGEEFKDFENVSTMWVSSYLLTLMGNIKKDDDVSNVLKIMIDMDWRYQELYYQALIDKDKETDPDIIAKAKADTLKNSLRHMVFFFLITCLTLKIDEQTREKILPTLTASVITLTNKFDGTQEFQDNGFRGLPMDNGADDIIFPCTFNEMWVPMSYATKATIRLRSYFDKHKLDGTGIMAWELYCSKPSDAWMSMSYTDGEDIWKEGAFRIDAIWFKTNSKDPVEFFTPVWELFAKNSDGNPVIPFRLHWGKHFPKIPDKEGESNFDWQKHLVMDRYPHLKDFLKLRRQKDPNDIFLTSYWRYWLCVDREDEL